MKSLFIGGMIFLLILLGISQFFVITTTGSIPPGIYIRTFDQISRSLYVKFTIDQKYKMPWLNSCSLIKKVIAIEGDEVNITTDGYCINDIYLGPLFTFDIFQNQLPHYFFSGYVQKGDIFVLGDNSKYSYDSRYFGPIKLKGTLFFKPFIIF